MANQFTYMYPTRSYILTTFYDHPASARRLSLLVMQKRKTFHCPAWEVFSLERVAGFVVCFLLGNSPAPEFYMPTFRNTLFHLHRQVHLPAYEDGTGRVFRNVGIIKFRRRGITQKKTYNTQNTAEV